MKLTSLVCIFPLLGLTLLLSSRLFAQEPIVLFTENFGNLNYSIEGREFEHKAEKIDGLSASFVKRLMAQANIPYEMKLRSWKVAYERVKEEPNYGIFSTARTKLREPLFEWIGPITKYDWVVLVNSKASLTVDSLDDLFGLKVGGANNAALTQYVESKGIEVSKITKEALNAKRLHYNLIDAWVAPDVIAQDLINKNTYSDIEIAFIIDEVDLYLALNKNMDPSIIEALQTAYQQLRDEES